MAINISNVKEWWTLKFYKESWYFDSIVEFTPVLDFLFFNGAMFSFSPYCNGFVIELKDVNLKACSFNGLHSILNQVMDFKKKFGDKDRFGVVDGADKYFEGGFKPKDDDDHSEEF